MPTPLPSTSEIWRERVAAWRASGQTASEFAQDRGFAASTLRFWSSRLQSTASPPAFVQLVPSTPPPPKTATLPAPELIVEVRAARIRVSPGFDPVLLARVVDALAAESE